MALVLVACSASDEVYDVVDIEESATPLDFAAYVTRYSRTAATEREIANVNALAQAGGFGVFGYAHGQRHFDDYVNDVTVPAFFVNQQVWDDSQSAQDGHKGSYIPATGNWIYDPVKYYDNNEGARHSFFAYAPYRKDVDMVFERGKAPQVRYDISQDVDLLWAAPTKDLAKPGVDSKITFNFSHALTKTTFHVAPFVDKVHADDAHSTDNSPISIPLPDGTIVKVRSIHLNGTIPFVGLMNTENGKWTASKTRQYFNVPGADGASWTGDGKACPTYYDVTPSNKLIPTQKVSIEVIYDVISKKDGITEHVTRKAVSQETFDLMQGKAYNFYLDLGLNTVKFFATVGDWTPDDQNVDLPEQEERTVLIETVLSVILDWQAGVSDEEATW